MYLKVMSPMSGIVYNDQMDDFSSPNITFAFGVPPSNYNHIEPFKRPLSSMSPTVLVDNVTGDVRMVIGAEGGTQITTAIAAVVLRTLLFGDDLKTAIDGPRVHDQLWPNTTIFERHFPEAIRDQLARKCHILQQQDFDATVTGIYVRRDRTITANADFRKQGSVDGY